MSKLIEFDNAISKNIIPKGDYDNLDRLSKINVFLESIHQKYGLNTLIQNNVEYTRGKMEYHCVIGYSLVDDECGVIIANGLGVDIEESIINSINNFIEYYNINKSMLKLN